METKKQPLKVEIEKILIRATKSFDLTKQVCEIENLYKGQTKPLFEEISKLKEESENKIEFIKAHCDTISELEQSLSLSQKENEELKRKVKQEVYNTDEVLKELDLKESELTSVKEQLEKLDSLHNHQVEENAKLHLLIEGGIKHYSELQQKNKELAEALEKVKNEWERQKGLFEILKKDGWMDNLMDNEVTEALTNYKLKDK